MSDKLPCTLSAGVVATREGLAINLDYAYRLLVVLGVDAITAPYDSGLDARVLSWPDAAERLRYREGEPWCIAFGNDLRCGILAESNFLLLNPLHRRAAILCDTAEGFRVLYWCVNSLHNPHEAIQEEE
jgi:hypothetical protein